jgi:Flp pilus assembly protein TadG
MSVRALSRLWRDVRGASAVEFALILTPLCLITFGIIEFGRAMWTREALQETASAGARCIGILQSQCASGGAYSSTKAVSYIQTVASGWGITVPTADITVNASTTCAGLLGFSTVTIAYNFKTVVPTLVPLGSGGTTMTLQACFPN